MLFIIFSTSIAYDIYTGKYSVYILYILLFFKLMALEGKV